MREHRHRFDSSVEESEPHDFAVRSERIRLVRRPRPPHPALYVRDDREAPLARRRDGGDLDLIWVKREAEYFRKGGLDR